MPPEVADALEKSSKGLNKANAEKAAESAAY